MAPRDRRFPRQDCSVGAFFPQSFLVIITHSYLQLTGSFVRVRYSMPSEGRERESEFPNHPNHIRPL